MAILDEFLSSLSGFLLTKDQLQLQLFLRVEPPLPEQFQQLRIELKSGRHDRKRLEQHIDRLIPIRADEKEEKDKDKRGERGKREEGDAWPGFQNFIREFLEYWRDVNFEDLVETHTQLTAVVKSCITAFANPTHGLILLPTLSQLSSTLIRLTVMLSKRPDLTRRLAKAMPIDADNDSRKSLVETTADVLQKPFTECLAERTVSRSGIGPDGKPEGRKAAIYLFANMILRLLFKSGKGRLAKQMFTNISQNSPPLGRYPASQRVTYLYYLGRFQFSNNHFYWAQLCLQAAYDQCHAQCLKHRRLILIHLIPCNMILGRFASRSLMSRPEAADLGRFLSISDAIKKGDMIAFKQALGPESGNDQWLFHHEVLLPILTRCEVLVWRSLARKVFLLSYQFPTDPNSRKAPTLSLEALVAAAQYCQKILEGWKRPASPLAQSGRSHINSIFLKASNLEPPEGGPKKLRPNYGVIHGNRKPDLLEIEAIVASLVQQGLLHGFISHNQVKYAILGAKLRGGPLSAGFPNVWEVLKARAEREGRDRDVPGWVQIERTGGMGGVVNLSGIARPVGSG